MDDSVTIAGVEYEIISEQYPRGAKDPVTALSLEHGAELFTDSAIDPAIALARGYSTLTGTGEDKDLLESLGFKPYVWSRDDAYPGLLIPTYGMDGHANGHQYKPAVPRKGRLKQDGTHALVKYETPKGAPLVIDVPPYTAERLRANPGASLWMTEGVKKVDSLVSQGMATIGFTGVFNWRNSHGVLGDWETIPLKGRSIVLCFDADAAGNRNVQLAMARLGAWLRTRGVESVNYLVVPPEVDGTPVKGVDDYFAAGGTLETLAAVAVKTPPGAGEKDAAFTDAFLVEELSETLQGWFCWASGLGWLRWNGRVWKEVSDVEPLEAVRVWASDQFDAACDEQKRDRSNPNLTGKIAGWRAILNKSRLVALRDLAKGLLQRDAAEFDGDPDLLTVGNGTVHLPSGRLLPFDPEHCITRICDAEYRPGASHPSWTAALTAVPADMHEWFRDRVGQATTGYMTPDHMMVIAHGGGSNGKSTVMEIIRKTLAGYGVLVSDRVLMASPDAHPTELMDFKGARYALMEETPEARHLNVQRLKQTVGTPTIKARRIRMDPVEFIASHSLFINTNYRPTVTETDHGTWRRLSLMPWPYTFRKPGQPLQGPQDRVGDPSLAYAANDPLVRAAALAWMVAGAQAWYARGRMMLPVPERVERETRDWRAETDLILGFADECLRFEQGAFTQTQAMLKAFNDWAGERGHRPWNDRTFASRFGSHDVVRAAKVQQGRFSVGGKQQRGWSGVEIDTDGMDPFTGERDDFPEGPVMDHYVPPEFGGPELDTPPEDRPAPERYKERYDDADGMDPYEDETPEPPREYGGCICGSTSTDKGDHADYCGFDRAEQAEARGERPAPDVLDEMTALNQEMQVEVTSRCPNCQGQGCQYCDMDRPAPGISVTEDGYAYGKTMTPMPNPFEGEENRPAPFDPENTDRELEMAECPEVAQSGTDAGQDPAALGFDLETADADKLFTGGHEGPFVRIGGHTGDKGGRIPGVPLPPVPDIIHGLEGADVIYGHNILGFDLLALAHHHGADYDALAAKAVDTLVLARLIDPPGAKGMLPWGARGYYGLDQVAQRLGHEGKTDDLPALAKRYGGYDKIPLDSREYQDYLRGDLAATKHVFDESVLHGMNHYARREMEIVALQNRMTLNGWAVDEDLLSERVAHEDAQRAEAVRILAEDYGMPTHRPDRLKLRKRSEWPEGYQSWSVKDARAIMTENPGLAADYGLAEWIPGERYDAPWAGEHGREAIERAFKAAGAKYLPRTKNGGMAMGKEALGEEPWYDKNQRKSLPGLLGVYGDKPEVRRIAEAVLMATGARVKYGEIAQYVVNGRVHAEISGARPEDKDGSDQASGRWAMRHPSLTNMGKRGAAGEERAVMVADPGHVLVTCDLSQVDMRAVAGLSQDPAYMELFQPGRDAHMEMAQVYFGEKTEEKRQRTKRINHKLNYGGGVKSTSEMERIPIAIVQQAYDARAQAYPRLMEWLEEVREEAASGRLLDNGFGRLMRPDPARAYTQGPALMGQGAARDIMCESLLRLVRLADERGHNVRPYLRAVVHDEVVLSVPELEWSWWAQLLEEAFTWEWRGVPILCEVSAPAFRWSECK
jgi:putative DNA primase/helicase